MPFYEYRCPDCENEFSLRGNMADCGADKLCPDCGSMANRILSIFNLRSAVPFRIMQEVAGSPGQYKELAFKPDFEKTPTGESREYWDGVDRDGDAQLGEKIEKETVEIALGNKEPPKEQPRHMPKMFPKGAPVQGLDPS